MPENAKHKIIVGVTGASGSIYAKCLFDKIISVKEQLSDCGVIFSHMAKKVWEYELGNTKFKDLPFKIYEPEDFFAPFASGSSNYKTMIICPCTMGTLGRIASGISNDLMTRAADVILKEKRKLILVPRESPYSLIHLKNMEILATAGAVILPASPSFYRRPASLEEVIETVIDRILDHAGFTVNTRRWPD